MSVKTQITASHWGTGVTTTQDGVLLRVEGHPSDTDPSAINGNYADAVYSRARVRRPSVRRGYLDNGPAPAKGQRGRERFVEVGWNEALDLVAVEVQRVRELHSNESIFAGSYGWASAGRFHHAQSQLKRFLNCLGGFVRSEGNYSYNAALVLMPHIVGNFRLHLKQATRWSTVAQSGELVVMFGGIPLRNAQVSGGGITRHALRDDLLACHNAGVEFVNFSPLKTDAIDELDAIWHAPRPGSDTAIMMAMAQTLIAENLYDADFVDRYTVGFDRVRAYLNGDVDGVVKSPTWAQDLSGIDADTIVDLTRRMARSRTLLCMAVGVQRAEHGEQPLWMTVTLAALLGQIGLAGGGYGIGYGADASIGTVDRPMRWPTLPQGRNPVSTYIPVANIADMLLHPGGDYPYNGDNLRYPDIRLVWWAGGNPFHHHQDLNRLTHAFQQPETIIVNEINWTATARHADIVLPVVSTLEREDFGAGTQDRGLVPMPKIIDPQHEAREEFEIYSDLARRLGVVDDFTKGRSTRQWLEHLWGEMQATALKAGHTLADFDSFIKGDIVEFDDPDKEHVFLADYRTDPKANKLPTKSGKIELYCDTIASFNYADCPGHATWLAPTEWLGAERARDFPLHLISGQPATRLHSQLDTGAYSQSQKIHGREPVLIHPADARQRGIIDGDVVRLFNERGSCLAGAVVTDSVRERVVFLWTGAWFDPDTTSGDQHGLDKHGNPNVLTHDRRTSSLSHGPASHSALVNLEKFTQPLPAVTAYDPPVESDTTSN